MQGIAESVTPPMSLHPKLEVGMATESSGGVERKWGGCWLLESLGGALVFALPELADLT